MITLGSEKIRVVGVCSNEAVIYDLPDGHGLRHVVEMRVFSHHGKALEFARDYEEKQRSKKRETDEVAIQRKSRKKLKDEGV